MTPTGGGGGLAWLRGAARAAQSSRVAARAPRPAVRLTRALAGAEPVAGAQHPAVQRLQFLLSESRWDPERVNDRRLELLLVDPATAPHDGGVLVIDNSGDRKDATRTAHVGHQWLGRYGKTDNGWSPSHGVGR